MRPWHKGFSDSFDDGFNVPNEPPNAPPLWAGPPSLATASVGSLGTIASFSRGAAASSVHLSAAADDGFRFPNEPPYAPPVWAGPPSVATASVGSLGTIASFSRGAAASSVVSNAAAPAPTQVTTAGSGLVINLNWDSSVGSAPAAFTNDMIAAAHFAESLISNAVTINLAVGYNEINGSALSGGALGESQTNIQSVSYSALVAALARTGSKDAADASVLASLPATNPAPGTVWVTTAQAKALGLSAANGSGTDGSVGFGTSSQFTYGSETTGTVAAGTYDFFATALHEMSEVMGRILLVGTNISGGPGYTLMDLLHYSAPGTRDFVQSTPGYFSINSGATNLGAFNTVSGGDAGDWASSVTNDPLDAFATSGVVESGSTNDLTLMDAIGWNLVSSNTLVSFSVAAETTWLGVIESPAAVWSGSPLGIFNESGGSPGDQYTWQLGGAAASAFNLAQWGTEAILYAGGKSLTGAPGGTLYGFTITETDTTTGASSGAVALNLVVGGSTASTLNLAFIGGIVASAPTFIYGLSGNDTIGGTLMTGKLFFEGGAGADSMTGGSGVNVYEYGTTSDSTPTAMDIITNFNLKLDMIDLTGIGGHFGTPAALGATATAIGANSIGWQVSGGNTFVYVNSGTAGEALSAANMKIELQGTLALTSTNIAHV